VAATLLEEREVFGSSLGVVTKTHVLFLKLTRFEICLNFQNASAIIQKNKGKLCNIILFISMYCDKI